MEIITANEFNEEIKEGLVLVDFFADWCGPCKMLAPVLEQIAEEQSGKLKIVKVNVDNDQDLAAAYGVMSIPNMVLFKDGEAVGNKVGFGGKNDLMNFLTPWLG
jgi:thioredoxin 1